MWVFRKCPRTDCTKKPTAPGPSPAGYRLKTCRRAVGERSHPPSVRDVVCCYLPERAVVAPGSTKSVYQWRQHPDDKAEVFREEQPRTPLKYQ